MRRRVSPDQVAFDLFAAARENEAKIEMVARVEKAYEWEVDFTHPGATMDDEEPVRTTRCYPTVETRTVNAFSDDATTEFRGACMGCDWRGDVTEDENEATESAHDHAWPGWRELKPFDLRAPHDSMKQLEKWAVKWREALKEHYPPEFCVPGAPATTIRYGIGTRHVPDRAPYGGYDMCVEVRPDKDKPAREPKP